MNRSILGCGVFLVAAGVLGCIIAAIANPISISGLALGGISMLLGRGFITYALPRRF